jgi:Ca2+-binding RTX toxin-like protein
LANITLSGGIIGGSPTSAADFVTSTDLVTDPSNSGSFIYFLKTGAGDDTIDLTQSFTASTHTIWTGAGDDSVTGGGGDFYDGSGNDTYRLTGTAFIFAGSGNDIYDGGKGLPDRTFGDYVSFEFKPSETGSKAAHTQNLTINLAKATPQALGIFGSDTLISIESVAGGNGNDTFKGTNSVNILVGNGGNDKLWGLGGNDLLTGGAGSDRLYGGKGADSFSLFELFENTKGRDTVVISDLADLGRYSTTRSTADVVTYFDPGKTSRDDRIDLSAIDTSKAKGDQGFSWVAGPKFSTNANWEIRLSTFNATSTIVQIDTDRDVQAEYAIVVEGVTGLGKVDFIL